MKFRLSRASVLSAIPALLFAGFFIIATPFSAKAYTYTPIKIPTVVALTNTDRTSRGENLLVHDPVLDAAAQKKANDMVARGYFGHVDPSGQGPWKWFTSVGYYYTHAGENLAVDFTDAQTLNTAWMNSPTHRANILDRGYTRIGIGIAHGKYNGEDATFVVQFFAKPAVLASAR